MGPSKPLTGTKPWGPLHHLRPPNLWDHQPQLLPGVQGVNPTQGGWGGWSPGLTAVTPINDLHGPEAPALAKGERLMRCKVGSIHRLLDLYGWAQLGHAAVTVSTPTPPAGPGGGLGGFGFFFFPAFVGVGGVLVGFGEVLGCGGVWEAGGFGGLGFWGGF